MTLNGDLAASVSRSDQVLKSVTDGQTDRQTDGRTDRRTSRVQHLFVDFGDKRDNPQTRTLSLLSPKSTQRCCIRDVRLSVRPSVCLSVRPSRFSKLDQID